MESGELSRYDVMTEIQHFEREVDSSMMRKIYHAVWIVGVVAHCILVFETWQHIDLYSVSTKGEEANVPLTYYFDLSLAVIALLTFLIIKHWVSATEKKMAAANKKAAE